MLPLTTVVYLGLSALLSIWLVQKTNGYVNSGFPLHIVATALSARYTPHALYVGIIVENVLRTLLTELERLRVVLPR